MFITIAVTLCQLSGPICLEKVVVDSNQDDSLTMQSCMFAQAPLAQWMAQQPKFHAGWRVDRIRCVPGVYVPRNEA
jgi:hypothetical protein